MSKKGREHLSKDPYLKVIIEQVKLPRIPNDEVIYNALLRAIIYQQLSGKAASTILSRFQELYGGVYPAPSRLLKSTPEILRTAGISRQKAGYLLNVAQFWLDHKLKDKDWRKSSNEEILSLLTQIKGVGSWTVQMLLMFTLKRPDVLPIDDLVIRNEIVKMFRLRSKGKKLNLRLVEVTKHWSPYRTLACRYLWAKSDTIV